MEAKRLRLAKWKQTKEDAAHHKQPTQLPVDPPKVPGSVDELTKSSSLKLDLSSIKSKRKDRKRPIGTRELDQTEQDVWGATLTARSSSASTTNKPTSELPHVVPESIDSFLDSLNNDQSSESGGLLPGASDDDSHEEDAQNDLPQKAPKQPLSKLQTIVARHSTEPFEKRLFQPTPALPASRDPAAVRLASGIQVEGSDPLSELLSPLDDWHAAGLPLPLMHTIESRGFLRPTPIQAQSLPIIMSGLDMVGIAPTSSGKTIAFLLPLCRHVAANRIQHRKMSRGPYALVLAPTRELCLQIFKEVDPLAKALQLRALGSYGGTDISTQISELINGRCDIMVATPGRLIDLLAANHGRVLTLQGVTFLVVDETDRMFDLGFGPQVRTIVGATRPDRQTVVFSATMSSAMESLVSRILKHPTKVTVGSQDTIPAQIEQEVILIPDHKQKFVALLNALEKLRESNGLALVFVDTQDRADSLTLQLLAKRVKTQALHGGMDQQDRAATIAEFRRGLLPVLVATSVAARGLDVRNLKLVVNFDAPSHLEDYVHRAGRTGRAGETGRCVTFLEPTQNRQAYDLTKLLTVSRDVQEMADEFARTIADKPEPSRLGFGGHGLANLSKRRDANKSIQQDVHVIREDSVEPQAPTSKTGSSESVASATESDPTPPIHKQGNGTFATQFPINDIPKEARTAVTAAGNQARVSADFHVSITIRGTFYPRPRKDVTAEQKLHLSIQGDTHDYVLGALLALREIVSSAIQSSEQRGRYSVL